jgi:hypothetical protein
MRTRSSAILLAALLFAPSDASAQLADGNSSDRVCTKCSDLCSLVDQYWEKERLIKVFQRYAASTPRAQRTALPAAVTDLEQFQKFLYGEEGKEGELSKALKGRELPCETSPWMQEHPKPPLLPRPSESTGLETKVFKESCEIEYGGKKLEGDVEKAWRQTHVCRGSAQAELEHEKVHQRICRDIWDNNRFLAVKRQSMPRNVAETELQAHRKHRDLLKEEIQKLAGNCGWDPTDRQKAYPDSVPSEMQMRYMEARGWKAFEALSSTPP